MKMWLKRRRWWLAQRMLFGALKVAPAGPARDMIAVHVRQCAGPLIAGFAATYREDAAVSGETDG